MHYYKYLVNQITNAQTCIAIMLGMLAQFMFSPVKTMRFALLILVSSAIVALYLVRPLLIHFHIIRDYAYFVAPAYAMSTVLSVAIMGAIINFFPPLIKKKIKTLIGVDNLQLIQKQD
jgi:uncharacterized membrane protein (DUF106 family)